MATEKNEQLEETAHGADPGNTAERGPQARPCLLGPVSQGEEEVHRREGTHLEPGRKEGLNPAPSPWGRESNCIWKTVPCASGCRPGVQAQAHH